MPVMSGPDATRAFRAWEREHAPHAAPRLPVFCITANVLEEHRLECETAGMCGFITKARFVIHSARPLVLSVADATLSLCCSR